MTACTQWKLHCPSQHHVAAAETVGCRLRATRKPHRLCQPSECRRTPRHLTQQRSSSLCINRPLSSWKHTTGKPKEMEGKWRLRHTHLSYLRCRALDCTVDSVKRAAMQNKFTSNAFFSQSTAARPVPVVNANCGGVEFRGSTILPWIFTVDKWMLGQQRENLCWCSVYCQAQSET